MTILILLIPLRNDKDMAVVVALKHHAVKRLFFYLSFE
jgi:hypothetical protein